MIFQEASIASYDPYQYNGLGIKISLFGNMADQEK